MKILFQVHKPIKMNKKASHYQEVRLSGGFTKEFFSALLSSSRRFGLDKFSNDSGEVIRYTSLSPGLEISCYLN